MITVVVTTVVLAATILTTTGDSLVVPGAYTNAKAPGSYFFFDEDSEHVIVYRSDLFPSWRNNGVIISGMTVRLDESQVNRQIKAVQEIQVQAGYTAKNPEAFLQAINGPIPYGLEPRSDTIVFPRATITTVATAIPNQLHPFNINIPFSVPFKYNPEQGNLFIHIKTFNGFQIDVDGHFSAQGITLVGSGGIKQGMYADIRGAPVALFTFTPIPEPSLIVFFALFSLMAILSRKVLVSVDDTVGLRTTSSGQIRALYKAPGTGKNQGYFDLGVLDQGGTNAGNESVANGISAKGVIVGQSKVKESGVQVWRAFVANNGSQPMQNLNDITSVNISGTWYTVASQGWKLVSAERINRAGWIVGYGTKSGVTRAFVLSPR